jgi:putative peptidoglycan lipid II flippase
VGRRGEFFDQDAEPDPPDLEWGPPVRAGRGVLYDQDASIEMPRIDPLQAARYQRELDRRREREIELQRERDSEARARRSAAPGVPAPPAPPRRATIQISSGLYGPRTLPPPAPEPPAAPEPELPPPPRPSPRSPARRPAPREPGPIEEPAGGAERAGVDGPAPVEERAVAGERSRLEGPRRPGPGPGRTGRPGAAEGPARPQASSTGRATAVLAAGTFASRLTGFVRVLAIGYVLGVGVLSDAFNYANGVPNIVYDLLLGGILSATLVPVFVEALDPQGARSSGDRRDDPTHSISAVMTAICAALVVVSGLLWLAAPVVIHFYLILSPNSTGGAERALATRLLRYFAPQVFFLGATVASTALLNARRRFAAAAVSPVINNLIAIAALLATKFAADSVLTKKGLSPAATLDGFGREGRAVLILGAGTTVGYAVQLLVQVPAMHRLGLRLRPVWDLRHPAVRRVAGLSSWLMGVVLANQASLALVMILAGRTEGGVTAYQFGYQFFQLPYALIAVSVASAIMPNLAEHWSARPRQTVAFERQFVTGLRVSLAVLVPVALVYMAVAGPFIELAIHHGAVGTRGAHLVTVTLLYFVAGLPGFSAFFLLMRAFQAMQDARTMFRIYVLENALTVVAALILSPLLGVPGLALAWVGPYSIASIFAVVRLRRTIGPLGGWLTVRALVRIAIASAAVGGAAYLLGLPFRHAHTDALLVIRLVLQAGGAGLVYVYMARVLGIREMRSVTAFVSRLARR